MRSSFQFVLVLTTSAGIAACGGGSDGGGTPPTPTPQSLNIAPGTSALRVSQTEAFSGNMTLSNGQAQQVQPTWQSDNVSVLTFEGSNVARGRAHGTATIIGTHQGLTATRLIRVFNNYHGTWYGDYTVTRCEDSGAFRTADYCDREDGFYPGDVLEIGLNLRQQADGITGDMVLGAIEGDTSGAVGTQGRDTGVGNLTITEEGVAVALAVHPLDFKAEGDRLTGTFTVTFTVPGASGQARIDAALRTVVRTGAEPFGRTAPLPVVRTVKDALRYRR